MNSRLLLVIFSFHLLLFSGHVFAQRAGENAVVEADNAFGTVVGNEVIGLYSSRSARGFSPTVAGNIRINGLYFDQATAPNIRVRRGSTIHVGISAQGYPLPAPTGVVDFSLRVPGNSFITSMAAGHGALLFYPRHTAEIDLQIPVITGVLNVGAGFGYGRNGAHQFAVRNTSYNGGVIAKWTPNEAISIIPFWSGSKIGAVGGDRPRVFIGENDLPRFRAEDLTSPEWLYFGFRQFNYGFIGAADLPDGWKLRTGLFRSESNMPRTFTAFVLNTNELGTGDYVIEQSPPRYTRSTSGEVRLSRLFLEDTRRHTVYITTRARDRSSTFGGGDRLSLGPVTIGAFPELAEPKFQTTTPTFTQTRQITGGVAYEGVWKNVGQLSLALQKSSYQRTLTRTAAVPVEGRKSPWLYNAAAAVYMSRKLAAYAGYTLGFEELGTAPGNAVNRDEAVPAEVTRQIDLGLRYQIRPNLQLVGGIFQIDKPYYRLDTANVFRQLGDIRHRGVELSLAGSITDSLTVVAGAVLLQPRIINESSNKLQAIGPIPRLIRVNLQYRPKVMEGIALEAKIESISARYITASNSHRISGSLTLDAGIRYTTTISDVPVRIRVQGLNLSNTLSVTPHPSGQVSPFEARRFELSIAADF